ncbi:MAG: Rrf2 family transcriptional regulator [Lachnospiraceae bacterium]|nr:Rrf2 family transcriptional regulator [Lachnospiraceae bacterium]
MFSTKGRYALRVMTDLAEQKSEEYIPLKDIAERQEISKKYLEIIVKELVKGGLVKGVSGKGGGYMLTRKPEEYSLGEIIELMEGSFSPVACLSNDKTDCPRESVCKTLPIWTEFYKLERDFFYGKKLSDLINS